jgi:hypothetical protein
MSNTTIYPYGTGGQLPSNIGIVDDLVTGGHDKALSAEAGKTLATTVNEEFSKRPIYQRVTEVQMRTMIENETWTEGIMYYTVEEE